MKGTLPNRVAIGTCSLGQHPAQKLDTKIRAAAAHGFEGIEVVHGELAGYAADHHSGDMSAAARAIRSLCASLSMEVISLCPFENYEGDRKTPLATRLAVADDWFALARLLGATWMQIPASYDVEANGDDAVCVAELQALADHGAAALPIIKIAYEPMSWSCRYPTWESVLLLEGRVNRANFGICLDTFHLGTRLWASPYSDSHSGGKYPNADRDLADSLARFVAGFPVEKLAYVQLSDAERFPPHQAFGPAHPWYLEGEAAEFSWSKHGRPFPLEEEFGGYMPIVEMLQAWIVDVGFKGWVSFESFDRRMRDPQYSPDEAAKRAMRSWRRIKEALKAPGANL